ncbi:hypothetical protein CDL15_Pgr000403 [Punica granatum]|uniref:Uncharacterized protein n=1 Tax=Punica granatum TaxID=22663 RepID=A0A218XTK4_PUNGR|nr:hypothetical protein CDL15_Pgr000403 [Punica granatum]
MGYKGNLEVVLCKVPRKGLKEKLFEHITNPKAKPANGHRENRFEQAKGSTEKAVEGICHGTIDGAATKVSERILNDESGTPYGRLGRNEIDAVVEVEVRRYSAAVEAVEAARTNGARSSDEARVTYVELDAAVEESEESSGGN